MSAGSARLWIVGGWLRPEVLGDESIDIIEEPAVDGSTSAQAVVVTCAGWLVAAASVFVMATVVLGEKVLAPVAVEAAPDGVDVVGIVLGVVVLDEKVGAGDVVVVTRASGLGAGPGEGGGVQSGGLDAAPFVGGYVRGGTIDVMADEIREAGSLLAFHG